MREVSIAILSEYSIARARFSLIELLERGHQRARARELLPANVGQRALAPGKDKTWHTRMAKLERLKKTLKDSNAAQVPLMDNSLLESTSGFASRG
jgi:hypothetical protein